MKHRDGDSILCVGRPGRGKTVLLSRGLHRDVVSGRPVVAFDPNGDVKKYLLGGGPTGQRVAKERVAEFSAATAAQVREAFAEPSGWAALRNEPRKAVVVLTPKARTLESLAELFVSLIALERETRGWVFVADEAQLVFENKRTRGDELSAITRLRNKGQRLYASTQRPQLLSTTLRQNATYAAIFQAGSRAFVSGCGEFCDEELCEPALTLAQFQYLYLDQNRPDPLAPLPRRHALTDAVPWP